MEKPTTSSSEKPEANHRILSLVNHLRDSLKPVDDIQKAHDRTRTANMAAPKFQGWMGLDKDSAQGKMVWQEFEPKTWTEDDVDIKITHCGICGSDLHTLRSGCKSIAHLTSVTMKSLLLMLYRGTIPIPRLRRTRVTFSYSALGSTANGRADWRERLFASARR